MSNRFGKTDRQLLTWIFVSLARRHGRFDYGSANAYKPFNSARAMQFILRLGTIPVRIPATLIFVVAMHALFVFGHSSKTFGAIDESNVLVLYNADNGTTGPGYQIANNYKQVHPGVHLVGLTGVNALLSGSYGEDISGQNYLDVIRPQVMSAIGNIGSSIDVIVTTKGLPLRIDVGSKPADSNSLNWRRYSSLESELTRVDSIDSILEMGDQYFYSGFPQYDTTLPSNPYYATNAPFDRSSPQDGGIRLTSRLDGYSINSVTNSIARAQKAFVVPFGQYVIADDDPTASADQMVDGTGQGPGLVSVLQSRNQAFLYENSNDAITTAPGPVIGYVSHGVHDGSGGLSGENYVLNDLNFTLAKGAVFLSHESYNAQSFNPSFTPSQGQVAQWLERGGTAGVGHVAEPFNGPDNVTNEDLLFHMLLPPAGATPGQAGLTWVEAAWNATRQLSYVNTVIGDPLMRFRTWLPGDANLDGVVSVSDLIPLATNYNQVGSFAQGNFNGDSSIDYGDLSILSTNWGAIGGTSGGSGSGTSAGSQSSPPIVPEPSTFVLLLTASAAAWRIRRRADWSKGSS